MHNDTLLEAVAELAKAAGAIALSHFRTAIDVELKADRSPVTAADRATEQFARDWIASRFPDDGIVGEEFGVHQPTARRRWLIDPIDGTRTFVAGVPLWGTLIGVCEGETALAGAASFPALGESIAAATGRGCWSNGVRCRVSSVNDVSRATVLTTDERFERTPQRRAGWNTLAGAASNARTWGDCYGYLLVATGRAEVMVDGAVGPWDIAPFIPIVAEAGGTVVDYSGTTTAFGDGAIATNASLASVAQEMLGVAR